MSDQSDLLSRDGGCMCGAVRFHVTTKPKFSACFCKMCQQWSSGLFMGVHVQEFEVTKGSEHLTVFKSSDWANRGFCNRCGSNIYYHAPEFGAPAVGLGTLDDTSGIENKIRFYVDQQPEGIQLAGDVHEMTGAECEAAFAPTDEGQ